MRKEKPPRLGAFPKEGHTAADHLICKPAGMYALQKAIEQRVKFCC